MGLRGRSRRPASEPGRGAGDVQGWRSRHRDRESIARPGRFPWAHGEDHADHRRKDLGRTARRSRRLVRTLSAFIEMIDRMTRAPLWTMLVLASAVQIYAQGARGGRGAPPPVAKAAAPIDVTGYWTAVITEDWHERMVTAPKGDFGSGTPGATAGFGGTRSTEANPSAGGNIS